MVHGKKMGRRAAILVLLVSATAACTSLLGDFTLQDVGSDAGVRRDGAVADAPAETSSSSVRAIAPDVSVYVRQAATVDASSSTSTSGPPAFAWTITSVPQGSQVTTQSLVGAATPTVTFTPDLVGEYLLQVTVRGGLDVSSWHPRVEAIAPQVLFAQGSSGDAGAPPSSVYTLADVGGSARPVLCPAAYDDAAVAMPQAASYAGRAFDFWEAPAGGVSRFAAFTLDSLPEGGMTTHLWAGNAGATCAAPPLDLGTSPFGPGRPFGSEPHFSPSGARFVVYDRQWRIVTYPADPDGGAPQVIAGYPVAYSQARSALDPSGLDQGTGYVFEPPRVEWVSETLLAWAEPTGNGWEVVTAPDSPDAGTPTTYMTCKGTTPRQIAMLGDGTVIASYRTSSQAAENIYQLKPNAQQSCTREQQYTSLADSSSSAASDFAVSPDGTQLAFLQLDLGSQDASVWMQGSSQLPGGYVNVIPVAGGTAKQVSPDPAIYGPRWIGGGTALAFTRLDSASGGVSHLATSVVVVAADGGAGQVIAQGDGEGTFVSSSGNAACTAAGRPLGMGGGARAAAALLGAAVAGALSRRRTRSKRR